MRWTFAMVLGSCALMGLACSDSETSGDGGSSSGGSNAGGSSAGGSNTGGASTGGSNAGGSGGGMCIEFGATCDMGATCCDAVGVAGECFAFGMGARCSIPCPANPDDCPNNGEGCNNMSPPVCKTN